MSSIRISETNLKKINELKQKHNYKNANDVITHLLEVNERFEQGKRIVVIGDFK